MSAELIEDYDWESDESEDWESDEAFAESEDSVEDIGEARRRSKQQRRAIARSRMSRPNVRGVQGVRVSGPSGTQSLRFPAKLATAAETNRGLAKVALDRSLLASRLDRLEARSRGLQKNDSSVTGLVTLAIGGSLTGFGALQASKQASGSRLQNFAGQTSVKSAAVLSANQLATSVAKLAINGRYHRSSIGMAADIFAAAQLALFAFGSLNEPTPTPQGADNIEDAEKLKHVAPPGTLIVLKDTREGFRVVLGANNTRLLLRVS